MLVSGESFGVIDDEGFNTSSLLVRWEQRKAELLMNCRKERGSVFDFLAFHTVHSSLNGRVSGPAAFRKRFLNFANGGRTSAPNRFHDLQFQLRELRQVQ